MSLSIDYIIGLEKVYREGLLNDTLPFWINNSVDREYGGFTFMLDRDGSVMDTDKGVWQQGRFTWLLATLYNNWEQGPEWLELAKHGIDFIDNYCFDTDGRMFFHLDQAGNPIRKRRYIFSETFAITAYAAYAKASDEQWAADKANDLWNLIMKTLHTPGALPPKFTANRESKSLALPMTLMVTAQELRSNLGDQGYSETIDKLLERIQLHWMKPEFSVALETVGINGEFIDHFDGRLINPGHGIELAWFILRESEYRNNDPEILKLGLTVLDWMWKWGWDEEYGGITYFKDVKGYPPQEYWHDMKFWWPQNEAIIATLMAYRLSGDKKYADMHQQIHDWTYKHFPDPEYGEWYGYLHRDGRISSPSKGNLWKGPFHIPRMQMICADECKKLRRFNSF
ncbi:MAG: AGE family epimerase/isomerase [Bacteroidota bacterium]|nr:AGE family epimerase/isomerase [Bacteroidota bacterium]